MATTVAKATASPFRQACSSWLRREGLEEGSADDIKGLGLWERVLNTRAATWQALLQI
ncbi:MAG: hypothetical protein NTZ53_09725 [Cyanobacteria bacterium]|nr:hypothetical protein [Cyanobacteriota bacterium]